MTEYLPLPVRQISDLKQTYSEREQFLALFLGVLLLGAALNYLSSVLFELLNNPDALPSWWLWLQLVASLATTAGLLIAATRIGILKPIKMHTAFYTGVLVKPAQGDEPALVLAPPADCGKTSVQRFVYEIANAYQGMSLRDPDQMVDLLQFALLIWYHHRFFPHWLRSPVLRTLGSEMMVGVQDADKAFVDAPQGIRNYATNQVLNRCAELREADTPVYGSVGLPARLVVPPGVELEFQRELWPAPHLQGRTRACHVLFEARNVCIVDIGIAITGQSILQGKEGLLPFLSELPGSLDEWYSYNYLVSVKVEFTEGLPLRLGWQRDRSKIEKYYRWSRDILEGLEEDFCWPLPFSEQCVDWET